MAKGFKPSTEARKKPMVGLLCVSVVYIRVDNLEVLDSFMVFRFFSRSQLESQVAIPNVLFVGALIVGVL